MELDHGDDNESFVFVWIKVRPVHFKKENEPFWQVTWKFHFQLHVLLIAVAINAKILQCLWLSHDPNDFFRQTQNKII